MKEIAIIFPNQLHRESEILKKKNSYISYRGISILQSI